MIKVGIISDTHGHLSPEVLEILKECDYILHAGDFASEEILDQIRFMGRIYAVRGNCDGSWAGYLKRSQSFEIGGVHFLMAHDIRDIGRDVDRAQVVVCGHTHRYNEEYRGDRLWLNPGTCGSHRHGSGLSMAVMEIEDACFTVRKIDLRG